MGSKYEDIIEMERPRGRAPMPRAERAVQFAPFAALVGYEDALGETARETAQKIRPGVDRVEVLNAKLAFLQAEWREEWLLEVSYFRPDERKAGGGYCTVLGYVEAVDPFGQCLILRVPVSGSGDGRLSEIERFNVRMERADRLRIPFDDLLDLVSDRFPVGDGEI